MPTPEDVSLAERWQAYQQLDRLTTHWYWRPGWREDRSFYTWHLTFGHATDLHELVTSLQRELDLPGLDHVPLEGLHLTMQGVGFADVVPHQDLDEIVAAARQRCRGVAPFELALGPVDPDAEGVGLLVRPWQPVIDLRNRLRDAINSVQGDVPEPADGVRPHVTIAYSGADAPAGPIRDRLAPLRSVAPTTVHIDSADLIRLRRDQRGYRWDTYATVPLGAAAER